MKSLKAGKNQVTFKSFGVELAGDLYLPEGFDENKKYKAIYCLEKVFVLRTSKRPTTLSLT